MNDKEDLENRIIMAYNGLSEDLRKAVDRLLGIENYSSEYKHQVTWWILMPSGNSYHFTHYYNFSVFQWKRKVEFIIPHPNGYNKCDFVSYLE